MHAPESDLLELETMETGGDELTRRLEQKAAQNPGDLRSLLLLGNAYYLQGRISLAIETFNGAVAISPENPYAYYYIGVAQYRSAHIPEAIEALTKVTTLSPSMVMAYYWLGIAHFHCGQYPEARSAFEILLERNKESHIAHYHAALICLAEGEYPAARTHLEALVAIGCTDPQVYRYLGRAHYHLHNNTEAVAAYRRGLELNPGNLPLQDALDELVNVQDP